jgi:hypothetical protein
MITSLIGGTLVALAVLLISHLKRAMQRAPRPLWARGEMLESTLAVGLVCMLALGFALIVSATSRGGWLAFAAGAAVAIAGTAGAIVTGARAAGAAATTSQAPAA